MRKYTDNAYTEKLHGENKNLQKEIQTLLEENLILQEENDSLKRENIAYYDTLFIPTSDEICVDNEKESTNLPDQSNIDYEKEIKKLKEIIQILLA